MSEQDEWSDQTSVDALRASVVHDDPVVRPTLEERIAKLERDFGEARKEGGLVLNYVRAIAQHFRISLEREGEPAE